MTPQSTTSFRKARPDAARMVAVPKDAYDRLGGIERAPLDLALMSWMLGGAVVTETKQIETPKGVVTVEPGQVWGSMVSMGDDLFAGLGRRYSRDQIRYALKKAPEQYGLQDLGLVHPGTRGKYGKLYALPDRVLDPNQPHVNVVKAYQIFHYGDPADFTRGERAIYDVQEDRWTRGRWTIQQKFAEFAAREGMHKASFTTIGRYRRGEEGDENAPVFVPWLTIDLDRDLLIQGYEDAQTVLAALEEAGIDMARVFCSFSGSKGFHIQVAMSQFGSPVFADALAAREVLMAYVSDLLGWYGVAHDPAVYTPHSLIRLTGSVHEKTGLRKRTWPATEFMRMAPQTVFAQIDGPFEAFAWADPMMGEVEQEAREGFVGVASSVREQVQQKRLDAQKRRYRKKSGRGPVIERIMKGVAESEAWHDYHVGRSKAAFILACWLLERGHGREWAEDALFRWNKLNDPPLRDRELSRTFLSACRTTKL